MWAVKLAVDARLLRAGGIGRYTRELVRRWAGEPGVESLLLLGDPDDLGIWIADEDLDGVEVMPWTGRPYTVRAQLRGMAALRRIGPGWTFFFPHYDVPVVGVPARSLVCVHDLIQYRSGAGFPWWKRALGAVLLRRAVSQAAHVVTVSEESAAQLRSALPGLTSRLSVVPNGVSGLFRPPVRGEEAAPWIRDLRPFLLTVGTDRPHKELAHAVRTLDRYRRHRPDARLVLVGVDPARGGPALAAARSAGVREAVVPLPRVSDEALRELYWGCEALLFPSRMEGFGLPPREALQSGARTLVADVPGMRELAAYGAEVVEGWSPDAWAGVAAGGGPPRGASTFPGWGDAAAKTLAVIRSITG